jgi:hypothetical protein
MKQHSNKKMAIIGAGLGLLVITTTSSIANADTPLDPIVCDVTGTVGLNLLCPGTNPLPDLPTTPLPVELPTVTLPDLPVDLPSLPAITLPQLPINTPTLPSLTIPVIDLPAITLPDLQGTSIGGSANGTIEVAAPDADVDATGSGAGAVSTSCDQPAAVESSGSAGIVATTNGESSGSDDGGLSLPETAGLIAVVLTVVKTAVPKVLGLVAGLLG